MEKAILHSRFVLEESLTVDYYHFKNLISILLLTSNRAVPLTGQNERDQSTTASPSTTPEDQAWKDDVANEGLISRGLCHHHLSRLNCWLRNNQLLRLLLSSSGWVVGDRLLAWWSGSTHRWLLRRIVSTWLRLQRLLRLLNRWYLWIQPLFFIRSWGVWRRYMRHDVKLSDVDSTKSLDGIICISVKQNISTHCQALL